MEEDKIKLNIEKFILFHRDRVALLEGFLRDNVHHKLTIQICFLGFESLAKLLYPKMRSGERFIELLSIPNMGVRKEEASKLYEDWRCSLIHEGFIASPWTCLEDWGDGDIRFLSFPGTYKSSTEYPSGSIVAMYRSRIDYLEEFFKKKHIKEILI